MPHPDPHDRPPVDPFDAIARGVIELAVAAALALAFAAVAASFAR